MNKSILLDNYSPAADIVVTALCFVMFTLVLFSYVSRKRSSKLFLTMIGLALISAWTDISFYTLAVSPGMEVLANWVRCIYHATLFLIFVYYVAYICEATRYEKTRIYVMVANLLFALVLLADIVTTASGITFTVESTGIRFIRHGIFIYGYTAFLVLITILLVRVRNLLFRRVMFSFFGTIMISFMLLLAQGLSGQSSFTVAALFLPMIAVMYMLHSNPYDALLGTNDLKAMRETVRFYHYKKYGFMYMSLYLKVFDEEGREMPEDIKTLVRQFSFKFFRRWKMFKVGNGHIVLVFIKSKNPGYEKRAQGMLDAFFPLYDRYHYEYKIVVGEAIDEISEKGQYPEFIRSIHRNMPVCSVHRVSAEDYDAFRRSEYILSELEDIYRKSDLDDPRVLAYCQPVLNARTGRYESGEALMRLDLKETGIISPDEFIPLAEEQGLIHVLTKIILKKTCDAILTFVGEGLSLKKISVNVSPLELKDNGFRNDIMNIIGISGVPVDKIAIEITESRNESDFLVMKETIEELKANGILFYLDDFGTGYSNMERIMELPFDIIKFDRSLVLAAGADERSRNMVASLARMFTEMRFRVLYEGVEKESDEELCKSMSACFLQGFRYSKPVPILEMRNFLGKKSD